MRKYGYSIKGEVPVCRRLLVRGQRVSAIAAIAIDGLLALNLTTETVNSDIFYDFIGGSLIPQMRQFDGSNPINSDYGQLFCTSCARGQGSIQKCWHSTLLSSPL